MFSGAAWLAFDVGGVAWCTSVRASRISRRHVRKQNILSGQPFGIAHMARMPPASATT
jgi:hypothetical protein